MAKKNASVNLFVYGTLRREERQRITPDRFDIPAFRRNAFLETGKILDDAPFLGFATTSGKLFDVGRYPGMIEGEGQVYGEVYQVEPDGLSMIDLLEGFDPENLSESHYLRQEVELMVNGNEKLNGEAYYYNLEIDHLPLIPSGDYCQYLEAQRSLENP